MIGNPREDYDKEKDDTKLIEEAKAFYMDDLDYERDVKIEMGIDIKMADNQDHWDDDTVAQRQKEKRPYLTVPRYNQFLNQIKNEQRQNKPSIKISARGAKSDDIQKQRVEFAKNRQGLTRYIQTNSRANDAYQTAYDFAVESGRGFFRIDTEYVAPDSFDLKIVINRIRDPLKVVMDRTREKIDYSDCKHGFIVEKIPREVFKNDYPDATVSNWKSGSEEDEQWSSRDDIWIVEYFSVRHEEKTLLKLDDNETIYREDLKDYSDEEKEAIELRVEEERKVKIPYVMWYKLTNHEVLDSTRIPGSYIPIIPVIGQEKIVVGRLQIKGLMRDLRDSIKQYNFLSSLETELIALSPKSPFVIEAGQIEGFEKYWATANTTAHAYLPYKSTSSGGKPTSPPQRQQFAGVPAGIVQNKQEVIQDQMAITGLHQASLGQTGPERSGKAITAQQRVGDISNFHYIDNMGIAIAHAGTIIQEWLPVIYDAERMEIILGEDGDESTINLNGQGEDGQTIGLGDGQFDVVVSMGPSYNTKRQEAAESMMQFIQAVPQFAPYIADLLAKNMDWPGAQEISERLKKLVPPEILEKNGGEEEMANQLKEMMGQLQQSKQMIEQMQAMIEEFQMKEEANSQDNEAKVQIANMNNEAKVQVAKIQAFSDKDKSDKDFRAKLVGFAQQKQSSDGR